MSQEWKPGDVASVVREGLSLALRTKRGWTYADGSTSPVRADGYNFRPLLVLDPDCDDDAHRLIRAFWAHTNDDCDDDQAMRDALRSLVAPPKPPKPDEPTGLGAVVEDANGQRYTRVGEDGIAPWYAEAPRHAARPYRYYSDLAIVRILSEGVS